MNSRNLLWIVAILAVSLAPFSVGAQGGPGDNGPLRATLSHLVRLDRQAASRGPETVRFDPRPLPARWSEGPDPKILPPWPLQPADTAAERDPGRVAEITRGVATSGTSRDVIVCPGKAGGGNCHMGGALVLIQASEPVVRNDMAKVFVRKLRLRPSKNQSLGESFFVLTLTRSEHGWSVTRSDHFGGS